MSNPINQLDEVSKITNLYADYISNDITLGELHDGVQNLIDNKVAEAEKREDKELALSYLGRLKKHGQKHANLFMYLVSTDQYNDRIDRAKLQANSKGEE